MRSIFVVVDTTRFDLLLVKLLSIQCLQVEAAAIDFSRELLQFRNKAIELIQRWPSALTPWGGL